MREKIVAKIKTVGKSLKTTNFITGTEYDINVIDINVIDKSETFFIKNRC